VKNHTLLQVGDNIVRKHFYNDEDIILLSVVRTTKTLAILSNGVRLKRELSDDNKCVKFGNSFNHIDSYFYLENEEEINKVKQKIKLIKCRKILIKKIHLVKNKLNIEQINKLIESVDYMMKNNRN